MNPLDNRYELNPALHRDMPENLFEDQGLLVVNLNDSKYPCHIRYKSDGIDFTIDLSIIKDEWIEEMMDDINLAIDRKFGNGFLSRKDLNLNIIGI